MLSSFHLSFNIIYCLLRAQNWKKILDWSFYKIVLPYGLQAQVPLLYGSSQSSSIRQPMLKSVPLGLVQTQLGGSGSSSAAQRWAISWNWMFCGQTCLLPRNSPRRSIQKANIIYFQWAILFRIPKQNFLHTTFFKASNATQMEFSKNFPTNFGFLQKKLPKCFGFLQTLNKNLKKFQQNHGFLQERIHCLKSSVCGQSQRCFKAFQN